MPKKLRFVPPKITDPPALVEISWLDAQSELDYEGSAAKAGGLVLLPTSGYHVRNGNHPEHGKFIVIAREYFHDEEGQVCVRDSTSIPQGWIKKWSRVTALTQIFPPVSEETKE